MREDGSLCQRDGIAYIALFAVLGKKVGIYLDPPGACLKRRQILFHRPYVLTKNSN